ncbi:acyl-CoA thioesterase/BAAT N-terminal domain-containing protein [Bacillus licheniformis]|nr:acyl-CoA thioesterase/BAAT N-terminal domain-containing protein [Bacillus licheniformis]
MEITRCFQANRLGEVAPASAAPLKGTYQSKDQMGLFGQCRLLNLPAHLQKSVHPSVYRIEVKQKNASS